MHYIFCSGGGMRPCCKQNFDFEDVKDYMLELDMNLHKDYGKGHY